VLLGIVVCLFLKETAPAKLARQGFPKAEFPANEQPE
jgi:hypothetical protein